jgi:hypothetical protein
MDDSMKILYGIEINPHPLTSKQVDEKIRVERLKNTLLSLLPNQHNTPAHTGGGGGGGSPSGGAAGYMPNMRILNDEYQIGSENYIHMGHVERQMRDAYLKFK